MCVCVCVCDHPPLTDTEVTKDDPPIGGDGAMDLDLLLRQEREFERKRQEEGADEEVCAYGYPFCTCGYCQFQAFKLT